MALALPARQAPPAGAEWRGRWWQRRGQCVGYRVRLVTEPTAVSNRRSSCGSCRALSPGGGDRRPQANTPASLAGPGVDPWPEAPPPPSAIAACDRFPTPTAPSAASPSKRSPAGRSVNLAPGFLSAGPDAPQLICDNGAEDAGRLRRVSRRGLGVTMTGDPARAVSAGSAIPMNRRVQKQAACPCEGAAARRPLRYDLSLPIASRWCGSTNPPRARRAARPPRRRARRRLRTRASTPGT